jgi:hypothetical protein
MFLSSYRLPAERGCVQSWVPNRGAGNLASERTATVSGDKTTLEAMGTPVQIISTTSFREMLLQLVPEVL